MSYDRWAAYRQSTPPRRAARPEPARRRNTNAAGYGLQHKRTREKWSQLVESGFAKCVRCGGPITPDQKWHLDHSDHPLAHRLGLHLGVSHAACNIGGRNRRVPRQIEPPRAKALEFFDVPPRPQSG